MKLREVCIAPHPHIAHVQCIYGPRSANLTAADVPSTRSSEAPSTPLTAHTPFSTENAGSWPRPFVGIVGSMHGDEPCGRLAIDALAIKAQQGALPLLVGTLFLIHGNPDATTQGLRHTSGGTDLNRLFSFDFVENLPLERWTREHHRALALRPLLESLDVAIDLHSASAPTPPFGIISTVEESKIMGRLLGLPYLTHGWEGPGLLGDRVLLSTLTKRGKPSFAVECGQHDDPLSTQRAHDTAAHFLVATKMLTRQQAPTLPAHPALELNIVDAVKKPSKGFEFHGRFFGLQQIPAGSMIGSDANLEIRCKRPSYGIMPNASVEVGQDMLYLAHQVDPATLLPPE